MIVKMGSLWAIERLVGKAGLTTVGTCGRVVVVKGSSFVDSNTFMSLIVIIPENFILSSDGTLYSEKISKINKVPALTS